MLFSINIPVYNANEENQSLPLSIEAGSSVVFVGANGSGKTRLAVYIEDKLAGRAHRIAAHRALSLNPKVVKIQENEALGLLKIGYNQPPHATTTPIHHRVGHRWKNIPSTGLLDDFNPLIQVLYANQSNQSLATHQNARSGKLRDTDPSTIPATKLEQLAEIWERLLPLKELHFTGDDIQVSTRGTSSYSGAEMSDGERSIFFRIMLAGSTPCCTLLSSVSRDSTVAGYPPHGMILSNIMIAPPSRISFLRRSKSLRLAGTPKNINDRKAIATSKRL